MNTNGEIVPGMFCDNDASSCNIVPILRWYNDDSDTACLSYYRQSTATYSYLMIIVSDTLRRYWQEHFDAIRNISLSLNRCLVHNQ